MKTQFTNTTDGRNTPYESNLTAGNSYFNFDLSKIIIK